MPKFSVKKPMTVFVAVIIVLVLGIVAFTRMTPDLLPGIDMPYVVVVTTYPGSTPEEVETTITKPMEQAMATLENIKAVDSVSNANYSMLTLEFTQDVNMDTVTVDILQKTEQVKGGWPDTVGTPIVLKINPSMLPVMISAVNVEGMDVVELSAFVEDTLMTKLEGVVGVASISASGLIEQSVQVSINQEKLDALNASIAEALDQQFADARQELEDARQEILDGKDEIAKGQEELEAARERLESETAKGEAQLSDSQMELLMGKIQIDEQLVALREQQVPLQEQKDQLLPVYTQITQLQSAQGQIQEGIDKLEEAKTTYGQLSAAMEAFAVQLENIQQNQNLTEQERQEYAKQITESEEYQSAQGGLATLTAQLAAMGVEPDGIDQKLEEYRAQLAQAQAGQSQLEAELATQGTSVEAFVAGYEELDQGLDQLNEGIAQLEATREELEKGTIELSEALEALSKQKTQATLELSGAATQLTVNESALESALSEIDAGMESIDTARENAGKSADLNEILTEEMLAQILYAQNFSMPAGYVYDAEGKAYLVSVGDKFESPEDMEGLLLLDLGIDGVDPIYLSDVADVSVVDNADQVYATINGGDGVVLSFTKQSGAATAEVSENLRARFEELSGEYEGLSFTNLMDQGDYIYLVVDTIMENLIFGALFAILILFLFLRDIRPTFITLCSIPISVIFAIVLMYFTGVTINMISLSGLAVAVGMLVDNSIVVIENIYRLRGLGASVTQAAVSGAKQVAGAIISSTLTTICVFLPIVFVEGLTRQLFSDMALTIAYSLMASLIVALTLVPAMASGMLKKEKTIHHRLFDKMLKGYERALRWSLGHKAIVLVVVVALLVGSVAGAVARGFILMPDMSMPQITVSVEAPEDENFDDMVEQTTLIQERISGIEGVATVGAMIRGDSETSMLSLSGSPISVYVLLEDGYNSTEVCGQIDAACAGMAYQVEASSVSDMSNYMSALSGEGIAVNVYATESDVLMEAAQKVAQALSGVEGVTEVSDGMEKTEPELHFAVDKEKAMKEGLTVAQVYAEIAGALSTETEATAVAVDGEELTVNVASKDQSVLTPEYVKGLTIQVQDAQGEEKTVAIGDIATVEERSALESIKRTDQRRYVTVTAQVEEGKNVTLLSGDAEKAVEAVELPQGVEIQFSGENESIMSAMSDLMLMLLLGILLVYLIMVAQFQSLRSPFIVLFTIPLAVTGGLLGLLITGFDLSIVSMIGFVMLAGIIVNNGIVLVDYINQLRAEGRDRITAIVEAGITRMRPILMTTITTVLGLILMAFGTGMGSELMQPLAVVCIGGLVYATALTLFVVPVIYAMLNKKELRIVRDEDLESNID